MCVFGFLQRLRYFVDISRKSHYSLQLSIEPISGTAMELKLRIQLNAIIPRELLSPNHANVSYVNKLIPIWWSETSAGIDAGTAEEFSSKVNGLVVIVISHNNLFCCNLTSCSNKFKFNGWLSVFRHL